MCIQHIITRIADITTYTHTVLYTHTHTHTISQNIRILCSFIVVLASFKMHSLTLMQRCESQAFSNSKPTLINLWISKRVVVLCCAMLRKSSHLSLSLFLALVVVVVLLGIFVFSAWLLRSLFVSSISQCLQKKILPNVTWIIFIRSLCIVNEWYYMCCMCVHGWVCFIFFFHFQHEIFFPCYFSTPYLFSIFTRKCVYMRNNKKKSPDFRCENIKVN